MCCFLAEYISILFLFLDWFFKLLLLEFALLYKNVMWLDGPLVF
jgi:hypothetical protein